MTDAHSQGHVARVPNDESEFQGFFLSNFDYVVRSLRRSGVHERDLDDVSQEVFVRVHARFSERNPDDDPRPWLWAFAGNVAANYRRLARHAYEVPADPVADPAGESNPEHDAMRGQQRSPVLRALAEVKEDRRGVLVLHDIDGVTAVEIAKSMKLPLNTVYSRLRLAREDFRIRCVSTVVAW